MIVKIHSRGSGGGKGPVHYLLGKDGKREDARLDQGNPSEVIDLIDGLKFAKKYTSGVLSFAESDLTDDKKRNIMRGFEATLFPGLEKDQYSILWVQHLDKGRLELNFVVPNVELLSGKRLQPYYDRADRVRVNAYKVACNAQYSLSDPDDPLRRKLMITSSDLPRVVKDAREDVKDGMLHLVQEGVVKNHEDVVQTLSDAGFEISAIKRNSISIKNPNGEKNARPIALRGPLFSKSFDFSENLQSEIQAASRRYKERAQQRITESLKTYREAIRIKREYHIRRFERSQAEAVGMGENQIITPDGHDYGRPSISIDVVSAPESVRDTATRVRVLGEVHSSGRSFLQNQGAVLDDGVRERAIESCRSIGQRARERATTNECVGEITTSNAGRVSRARDEASGIRVIREYANRAVRAVSQIIESTLGSVKLALSRGSRDGESEGLGR